MVVASAWNKAVETLPTGDVTMHIRAALPVLLLGAAQILSVPAAQAASTSAHAMIVSGLAGHPGGGTFDCATSGPQPMSQKYFGSASVGLPTEGYAYCHLAGGIDDTSSASGISTAHEALTNSFSNGTHIQTADAVADFGVLKTSSNGSYTGDAIGGFAYHDGEAAAYSTDTLQAPGGASFVQFGFTIDGAASVANNSQILSQFAYQIDSGPIFTIFSANLLGTTGSVRGLDGSSFGDLAGYTVGAGSASGSDTVYSFRTAVAPGGSFDLTLAMLAASYPSPFGGVANVDFSETARLSWLRFYDASGVAIDFGDIIGASGRLYDSNGVHTLIPGGVPEPASWAMMLTGFAAIGGALRSRRSRNFRHA